MANDEDVAKAELTSSMHCVYWSRLAASRAVSPAEFTVGRAREDVVIARVNSDVQKRRKKKKLKGYPCVALLLLWAVTWETRACGAGRCSEEPCFPPLFSSPNSCCEVSTKHAELWGWSGALSPCSGRWDTNSFLSDLFWQRKSTNARELFSSRRTARWRAVSLIPWNQEEDGTN